MSSPTTPARSKVGSGPSTPSTSSIGASQQQLTPRSKVKAMLAAIDDDTDSGHSSGEQRPHSSASNQEGQDSLPRISKKAKHGASLNNYDASEGDESDHVPAIPRGRLAARLHDRARQINPTTNAGESSDGNAYERLRKQLLPRTAFSPEEKSSNPVQGGPTGTELVSFLGSPIRDVRPHSDSESPQFSAKSTLGAQRASPGLFPTPKTTAGAQLSMGADPEESSDSDLPADPQTSSKLQLLVARKREELQAKKVAKAQKKAERKVKLQSLSTNKSTQLGSASSGISAGDSDDHSDERRLTQQARPTRKASKKALEEMNRETQRMSRNMQLAHEAKTKKKISKESFFTRFNYRATPHIADAPQPLSSSTLVSSAQPSDTEGNHRSSPPTSPAGTIDPLRKSTEPLEFYGEDLNFTAEDVQDVIPKDLYSLERPQLHEKQDKSSVVTNTSLALTSRRTTPAESSERSTCKITTKLRIPGMVTAFDSDSDLEIIPNKKLKRSKLDVFERLPTGNFNEDRSLQTLRVLAHMNSPGKRNSGSKSSMTMSDMHMSLQKSARRQAAAERAERIRDLKVRGVIVQTAEEREKDQEEVEDLVEKARREAMEIMQKEKRKARKEKLANGELDGTELTSDEDEDYQDDADESDINFSGSEEDHDQDDVQSSDSEPVEAEAVEDGDEEGGAHASEVDVTSRLVNVEASEDEQGEGEPTSEENEDEVVEVSNINRSKRRRRTLLVIHDDEDEADESEVQQSPAFSLQTTQQPQIPGLPSNALPMGMTQAFVATMADTQSTQLGQSANLNQEQDSLTLLGPMPEPDFPVYDFEDSQQMVLDSQNGSAQFNACNFEKTASQEIEIHFSQGLIQHNILEDTQDVPISTQYSDIPDPTQDVGFTITSPIQNRFVSVPPSTVDTVLLSGVARNSPIVKKKGRLRRRTVASDVAYMDGEEASSYSGSTEANALIDAFNVMKKAARKPLPTVDAFDKDKSEAKAMVEEQAQESEDEYAGLGGVSDDESAREGDDEVQKMIVEEEVEVDGGKLAAFYADKERANDEKAVERLFRDINSGMLRRKRGAEFELSDSDDDLEARQRAKRKEFAKMRKALLENENVGRIAQDPKKLAFLRAIEDQEHDPLSFLDQQEESSQVDLDAPDTVDSQSQPQPPTTSVLLKRKRPLQDSIPDNANRPPPSVRSARLPKKPSTFADIRKSVSLLIEQPGAVSHHAEPSSSPPSSDNEHNQDTREPFVSRRRTNPVIDRLVLKRAESTTASTSRLAFHDPASAAPGGFRVPSLLRRATTSQLTSGADKHGISTGTAVTERAAGGGEKGDFIKRGGSWKSSIGYFAREKERQNGLEEADRKRREGLRKMSLGSLGLGRLASGTFD